MILTFDIEPRTWKRTIQRGSNRITDPLMRQYKNELGFLARMQWKEKPFKCPIGIEVVFWLPRPRNPKNEFPCRGDVDNYLKAVCDALENIVWENDRWICEKTGKKWYTTQRPRIDLRVWRL